MFFTNCLYSCTGSAAIYQVTSGRFLITTDYIDSMVNSVTEARIATHWKVLNMYALNRVAILPRLRIQINRVFVGRVLWCQVQFACWRSGHPPAIVSCRDSLLTTMLCSDVDIIFVWDSVYRSSKLV